VTQTVTAGDRDSPGHAVAPDAVVEIRQADHVFRYVRDRDAGPFQFSPPSDPPDVTPETEYVMVVIANGRTARATTVTPGTFRVREGVVLNQETEAVERSLPGLGDFIEVGSPILSGVAGTVHVGMDLEALGLRTRRAVGQQLYLLCIILVTGVLASIWLVNLASRPMAELLGFVVGLARERDGSKNTHGDILVRDDEIGDMARLMQYVASGPGGSEEEAAGGSD
jgi:hypothetical protein